MMSPVKLVAAAVVFNVVYKIATNPFIMYGKARYPVLDAPDLVAPTKISENFPVNADSDRLAASRRLLEGVVQGPETIIFDSEGKMYTMEKGGIYQADPDGSNRSLYVYTGGRPLGAKFDSHGNLYFADLAKGLAMVEAETRRVIFLTDRVSSDSPIDPDTPIQYADDLDVASDGTVYFSDACMISAARFANGDYDVVPPSEMSFYQGPTGRLVSFDPASGTTTVLYSGLYFANGVALSSDESFLLVASTVSSRVFRFWLKGAKAGTLEPLTDLPGMPDGISSAPDGSFWVALFSPTVDAAVLLAPLKLARTFLSFVPSDFLPKAKVEGSVIHISKDGEVIGYLQDPTGATVRHPTSAIEHNGKLYIGSLTTPYVSVMDL